MSLKVIQLHEKPRARWCWEDLVERAPWGQPWLSGGFGGITSRSTLPSSASGGATPNHGAPRGHSSSPPSPSTSPPPSSSTSFSSSSSATAVPCPSAPSPRRTPLHGPDLRHDLRRDGALRRRRDPRLAVAVALLANNPFQWLLCFPLGTRPSGRVFFWSYIYYLSRFLHALRSFNAIIRYRKLSFFKLFNHSISIFMSFLWLEFSQSFQVLAILLTTLVYSVVYGYRFWTAIGLPSACFPFVVNCQIVLLSCNLVCHFGVLLLHFIKGGCNGIGAWIFNSVLNGAILFLFLNFYVKRYLRRIKAGVAAVDGGCLVAEKMEMHEVGVALTKHQIGIGTEYSRRTRSLGGSHRHQFEVEILSTSHRTLSRGGSQELTKSKKRWPRENEKPIAAECEISGARK
ncbi:hypothetical protein DH2020_037193 [Rehmannia glutinosa]|uniref:Elongation of fatty acids protein 3-like n=1 Tax=Rehmannia glutinosa TaxID=99300 RepID=A0ABR0V455_REHGL